MTPERLSHIVENLAYQHYIRNHSTDRAVLCVLLNYGAYQDVRREIYRAFQGTQDALNKALSGGFSQTRTGVFEFRGVQISWSPLVSDPEKYIFGVTELTPLP